MRKILILSQIILVILFTYHIFNSFFIHKENIKYFYKNVLKKEKFSNSQGFIGKKDIKYIDLINKSNRKYFDQFKKIKSDTQYYINIEINKIEYFMNNNELFGLDIKLNKDPENKLIKDKYLFIKKNYIKFHIETDKLDNELIIYMNSDSKKLLLGIIKNNMNLFFILSISILLLIRLSFYIFPKINFYSVFKRNILNIERRINKKNEFSYIEPPLIIYIGMFSFLIWFKIFSDVKLWYLFYGLTVLSILLLPKINYTNYKFLIFNKAILITVFVMFIHQIISRFGYQGSMSDSPFINKILIVSFLFTLIYYYFSKYKKFITINFILSLIFPLCILEFRSGSIYVSEFIYFLIIFIPSFLLINKKLSL